MQAEKEKKHPCPWSVTRLGRGWVVMDANGCHLMDGLTMSEASGIVELINAQWRDDIERKRRQHDP